MYSLSLSLWPRLPLLCLVNIRQLEFHRITILTRFVLFVFVLLNRHLFCCLWWVGLFFVAPSLAVFQGAYAFNQNVSKWNTGAVTHMQGSKCTLSPSLWPRLPLLCILNIDDSSVIGSQFSHVFVILFLKFFTKAVSNEHCAVANGNLCLQTMLVKTVI